MKQTNCVDNIKCPYCGEKFDGGDATNYDTSINHATCPACGKLMELMQSIEYTATEVKE